MRRRSDPTDSARVGADCEERATESEGEWDCVYMATLGPRCGSHFTRARRRRRGQGSGMKGSSPTEGQSESSEGSRHTRSKLRRVDVVFSLRGPGLSGCVSPEILNHLGMRADTECGCRGTDDMDVEKEGNGKDGDDNRSC
eukprot:GHVU01015845.1.p2 GENE.GHVU01015845.1~~GHVU01015845.1.p2  ORF type:complete len:141 (+),score=6.64 GHVU01015845.1:1052-1474(+)